MLNQFTKKNVFNCGCKSEPSFATDFQDKVYGKGFRLHTVGGTKERPSYTCTICGKRR